MSKKPDRCMVLERDSAGELHFVVCTRCGACCRQQALREWHTNPAIIQDFETYYAMRSSKPAA